MSSPTLELPHWDIPPLRFFHPNHLFNHVNVSGALFRIKTPAIPSGMHRYLSIVVNVRYKLLVGFNSIASALHSVLDVVQSWINEGAAC